MAGNQRIIEHSGFKAAIDSDYINLPPKSTIQFFEDSKNLSPHDKIGSLSQCQGHEIYIPYSDLPKVTDYRPIDFYFYSIDKDNKEIKVFILEHISTGEIKIFITPWFNPDNTYSNHNPNKTANSWINEWLELTEKCTGILNANSSGATFTSTSSALSTQTDFYNGWFVVNTSIGFNGSRFNFITDFSHSAGTRTFTCKTNPSWSSGNNFELYRFPVVYLHRIEAPTPLSSHNYSVPASNIFLAKPTEFRARENQLRIACGKDYRPLILDFIYQRKYFKGSSEMSYYGFWFDFSQIPQVQDKSAVTGFASQTTSNTATLYIEASTGKFVSSAPTNGIKIDAYAGSINLGINHTVVPSTNQGNENLIILVANNIAIVDNKDIVLFYQVPIGSTPAGYLSISLDDAVTALNSEQNPLASFLTFSKLGTGNLVTSPASYFYYHEQKSIGAVSGAEAGSNIMAANYFIGSEVFVNDAGSGAVTSAISRNAFILTAIYDNRNEILLGHGTCRPSTEGTVTTNNNSGYELRFTTWFSRRLTQFAIYSRNLNNRNLQTNTNSLVKTITTYPYYAWENKFNIGADDYIRINELPLLNVYDIYEFDRTKNGERVTGVKALSDSTQGINSYTLKTADYYWYTKFRDDYNGVKSTGSKVRFIVNTNRYIDQDTTLNYTRSVFIGQTNGRMFLVVAKNTVEKELFENDDYVMPSNYAYGVSQYDIYIRDRFLPISQGDKDIIKTIHNQSGRLVVAKQSNIHLLEVNTGSDISYRTLETNIGRGTDFIDAVLETPYGILNPNKEGIWLINGGSYTPIFEKDNGKLLLYRNLITNLDAQVIGSAFSNDKNQAYFFVQRIDDSESPFFYSTYIFIYNFTSKTWTYQYLGGNYESGGAGIIPVKVRTNFNKDILFLNYYNTTNYNIIKLDATNGSSTFFKADGTSQPILWNFETIFTAYNGVFNNISLEKIWLDIDTITDGNHNLTLRIYLDNISTYNDYSYPLNSVNFKNFIAEILPTITRSPTFIKIQLFNNSALDNFCLNNLLALDNSDKKNFTNDNGN